MTLEENPFIDLFWDREFFGELRQFWLEHGAPNGILDVIERFRRHKAKEDTEQKTTTVRLAADAPPHV